MGKGEKKMLGIHHADTFNPISFPASKRIPVLGMAQLRDNGFWAEVEYPVGHGDGYLDFPSHDRDAYGIRCIGDSILPQIKDGEFVVIEPNHPVENGDEALVKAKDGRVMIKILLYQRASRTHLMPVNTEHAPLAIVSDDIDRLHYVAAIVNQLCGDMNERCTGPAAAPRGRLERRYSARPTPPLPWLQN